MAKATAESGVEASVLAKVWGRECSVPSVNRSPVREGSSLMCVAVPAVMVYVCTTEIHGHMGAREITFFGV
jgi:hypothetical protein